ncbi:MAG: hypothetical protein L0H79_10600 [Intrasporangium sp.]|uniref:hypothetical protein n=1 Tax=Intrasporangium sp. TaxID=1925024 RepID=UPI002647CA39|nr:hypothetical protein [Intrasporangium sp.]MDN5796183.1 hypothetical protein [Intrasporangium sp.]
MERLRLAFSGALAAALAMATGHLLAALTAPSASPVLAVGSAVIDLTPTPVKEWAVAHFGTADKAVLVGGVLLVTLVVAVLAGLLSRRHPWVGPALFLSLGALSGLAALSRPVVSAADLVPALVATVTGLATFAVLTRLARRERGSGAVTRRGFLLGSLGAAASTVALLAVARAQATGQAVRRLVLPRPASPAGPLPVGLETTSRVSRRCGPRSTPSTASTPTSPSPMSTPRCGR